MSKDQINKSDFDNIFSTELYFLSHAEEIFERSGEITREELLTEFNNITENYANLLKQTKKLIKIGDSTQRKLRNAQQKLQEQNERINAQNDQLRQLNATKDKFFSIISHDLRNPITSVLMMAEILKYSTDKMSPEEVNQKIDVIIDAIKRLFDLFENLLRWSKTQTGKIKYNPELANLNAIVKKIFNLLSFHAESKNIRLTSDMPEESTVFADKNMLETVLRNLTSNAVKFTKNGGEVSISAEISDNNVLISVKDNGIGISASDMEKLFRIEGNFKTRGTANEQGSGLGLILCKEFIEIHGGRIWAESHYGKGSEFKFTIPLIK